MKVGDLVKIRVRHAMVGSANGRGALSVSRRSKRGSVCSLKEPSLLVRKIIKQPQMLSRTQ
jgi:hypothetical protein